MVRPFGTAADTRETDMNHDNPDGRLSTRGLLRGADWTRATANVNRNILVHAELRDAQNRVVVRPSDSDLKDAELCGIELGSAVDEAGKPVVSRNGLPVPRKLFIPWESRRAPGAVPLAPRGHAKLFNAIQLLISSVMLGSMPTPDVVGVMIDQKREVFLHSFLVRLLQGLLALKLGRVVEAALPPTVLAYRPLDGVRCGLFAALRLVGLGFVWVAKADIRGFFPAIKYEHVAWSLPKVAPVHDSILRLIEWMLSAPILRNVDHPKVIAGEVGVRAEPLHALYQGSSIAPLLSNVVGAACFDMPFAAAMAARGVVLLRYADDLLVLARDRESAEAGLDLLRGLAMAAGFQIHDHPDKTSAHPLDVREETITWLGYELGRGRVRLSDAKFSKMVQRLAAADPSEPREKGSFIEPLLRLVFDPASRLDDLREEAAKISDEHFHRIEESILYVKNKTRTRWIAEWQRHTAPILKGAR